MPQGQANAHGGFTPAAVAPPIAINLVKVIHHHHSQSEGRFGGTGTVPSFIITLLCILYTITEEIIWKAPVIHHVCQSRGLMIVSPTRTFPLFFFSLWKNDVLL